METDPTWGPYTSGPEALLHIGRFVDSVCGPDVGIAWTTGATLYPLRAPHTDKGGSGDILVFEWIKPSVPSHAENGIERRIERFIEEALDAEGNAALANAEISREAGQALAQAVDRVLGTHQDDALGVALDIVGIALTVALVPTGIGAVAAVALVGGLVLLGTDTYAYALEMGGEDREAELFKQRTEYFRIAATVMTLPDAVYGGYRALRELNEVRELRATAQVTASTAQRTRSASPARVAALRQVADRANLRAQIRTQQIRASLIHEISPRGAGLGSAVLLLREEIESKESALNDLSRFLRIHCMTVTR